MKELVLTPQITEKSYQMANAENKYTFLVPVAAEKIEIGKGVAALYKVTVEDVRTITLPGKSKKDWKTGRSFRKSDKKKAIVTLKAGDKIDDFFNI